MHPQHPKEPYTLGQVIQADWPAAFELLASSLPAELQPAQVQLALQLLHQGELDPAGLIEYRLGEERAVGFVELTSGQVGIIWHARSTPNCPAEGPLLVMQALRQFLERRDIPLALGYVELHDHAAITLYEATGFARATILVDLQCKQPSNLLLYSTATPLRFVPWSEENADTFITTLLHTYHDSLDAPELNQERSPDEIIAGLAGVAKNRQGWQLAFLKDQPVGVLIVTLPTNNQPDGTIVYLGLIPTARRQRLGDWLLQHIYHLGTQHGIRSWHVQLDERNIPGQKLYQRHRFQPVHAKYVYTRTKDGR